MFVSLQVLPPATQTFLGRVAAPVEKSMAAWIERNGRSVVPVPAMSSPLQSLSFPSQRSTSAGVPALHTPSTPPEHAGTVCAHVPRPHEIVPRPSSVFPLQSSSAPLQASPAGSTCPPHVDQMPSAQNCEPARQTPTPSVPPLPS